MTTASLNVQRSSAYSLDGSSFFSSRSGSPWSDPVGVAPLGQHNRADDPPGFAAEGAVRADRFDFGRDHGLTGCTLESPSTPGEHYFNPSLD